MAQLLKQSTAFTFQLGPFIDDTDGKTAEAALTIAAADCFVSKNGGAYAAKNDATAMTGTGDARGYYDCVLNATDTGTLGPFEVAVHVTGALPVWRSFMVVPPNVYDSLVGGVEWLEVCASRPVWTISAGTLTVKEQNGTTTQFTRTVAGTNGADPVASVSA